MALSDPQSILASPLAIIEREGGPSDIETILELARQNQVERIIVGLPLSMNGTVGQQAEKVKVFTQELSSHTEIPVEFRDERLSTVSVKLMMRDVKKGRRIKHDAMAAAFILQNYLDETLG